MVHLSPEAEGRRQAAAKLAFDMTAVHSTQNGWIQHLTMPSVITVAPDIKLKKEADARQGFWLKPRKKTKDRWLSEQAGPAGVFLPLTQ